MADAYFKYKAGIGNAAYRRLIDDPTIDLNVIDPPGYSSTLIGSVFFIYK